MIRRSDRRVPLLVVGFASVTLLATACGGGSSESSAASGAVEASSAAPEVTEAPASSAPAEAAGYMSTLGGVSTEEYVVDYDAANTDLKIGYEHPGDGVDFWNLVAGGMEQAAADAGVELKFYNGKGDAAQAIQNVQLMINEGVDAAIIYQCDAAANTTIADLLKEANIPVVGIDCPVPGAAFFGGNNAEAGSIGGAALGEKFVANGWPAAETAMIYLGDDSVGDINATRGGGYKDGFLATVPDFPADNVFVEDVGANTAEAVQEFMDTWIAGNPGFKYLLIGTLHDGPALGAYQAVQNAGRAESSAIISQGCDGSAQEFIRKGDPVFLGSVDYGPKLYGKNTISEAIDLANGDAVPLELFADHALCDATTVDTLYPPAS